MEQRRREPRSPVEAIGAVNSSSPSPASVTRWAWAMFGASRTWSTGMEAVSGVVVLLVIARKNSNASPIKEGSSVRQLWAAFILMKVNANHSVSGDRRRQAQTAIHPRIISPYRAPVLLSHSAEAPAETVPHEFLPQSSL